MKGRLGATGNSRQAAATLSAVSAIALWSTVATAFKLTLGEIEPLALLAVSSAASASALFAVLALRKNLRGLLRLTAKRTARAALLGLLNPFAYYLTLFNAYDILPAQEAQPLNYTWPLTLAVFSVVFLRQRIRPAAWAAMAVSFAGVLVISTRGDIAGLRFTEPLGAGLAIGSSVIWAAYWVLAMRSEGDPVMTLFLSMSFGAFYSSILAGLCGAGPVTAAGALGAAYVGVFEMGITFVLWLRALRLSENTARVGNLVFLSPFLSLPIIHLVAGEAVYGSSIAGLVLIVGGIILHKAFSAPSRKREQI